MALTLSSLSSLRALPFDDIVDVRSPAEFAEDHIPGAMSLPVLDDTERSRVGTVYTRVDRFQARKIGAALVARNAAAHLEGALAGKPGGWRPLVYCWRGGQRSGSFAAILAQIGWRVETIAGGYRSYRRLVAAEVHDRPLRHRLVLLDGNTGTAKTELLGMLAARGHQVLDLEGRARHRGSVFGARGVQPSQKAFEGALAMDLAGFDPSRPVLVEAESSAIGRLLIPPSVWKAMRVARRIRLSAPAEERARYLVRAYDELVSEPAALLPVIAALTPIQGRKRVEEWQELARSGAFEDLALELVTRHYDPRYEKSLSRAGGGAEAAVALDQLTPNGLQEACGRIEAALSRLVT